MVAAPESAGTPSGTCHHHAEKIAVTKEKLFELAVSLAVANISAGQFNNGANFGAIVFDDTQAAYDQLEKLWQDISGETDAELPDQSDGSLSH